MQPEQTPPHNPYDFITNPSTPPKKTLLGAGSAKSKIFAIIGIVTILTIVLALVATLLGGGSDSKTTYTKLLQQQTEIIRIADLGSKDGQSNETKNLSITVSQTLVSTKKDLTALAEAAGADINPKTIALGKDAAADKSLTTASQINNYDQVFTKILTDKLNEYKETLKQLYDGTSKQKTRDTLESAYKSVDMFTQTNQ